MMNGVRTNTVSGEAPDRKRTECGTGRPPVGGGVPDPAAGLSVIMTGSAGCGGTSALAREKEEELAGRFSRPYLKSMMAVKKEAPARNDILAALSEQTKVLLYEAGAGGILTLFWELSAGHSSGIEIDLRSIPVRQETVELCEYFSLNPYTLDADGAFLILTAEEREVTAALDHAGIPNAVIGTTRSDQKKLLKNKDAVQYLNRPVL